MNIINTFMRQGVNAGLQKVATTIFKTLVSSKSFRNTVIETEKAVIKGIRFAGDPKRETNAFNLSEKETLDHLAQQARQAASGQSQQAARPNPSPPPPSNMTAHGYQPESEWSRWYKTKRYEWGMLKNRWFK